jgi:hemoglobin/transferrin/lactoferrin receptor protein
MKRINTCVAVLFLLLTGYHDLKAQDTSYTTRKILLDEMVIHANRIQELKKDVPQQMQVISAREIQSLNARNTADLLALTGCITVQKSQQGGGSPNIRGFEANRILLVIDGVRMNNIIYRAGHLQNVITIDQAILDHAEVLFGPSSCQYGSDALGGAILFYTKKPELATNNNRFRTKANLYSRFASVNNERSYHFDFNLANQHFGSLTSLTYSRFGDIKMGKNNNPFYGRFGERKIYADRIDGKDSLVNADNIYLQKSSGYDQYDLIQKFLFNTSSRSSHILNFQLSNSSNVPRYDRLTDLQGAGLKYADWYYGPQLRLMAAYENNLQLQGCFQKLTTLANYQYIEESRHDRKFGKTAINNRYEYVNVYGISVDASGKRRTHEYRLGIDASFNTLVSRANTRNILTDELNPLDTRYPAGENYMFYLNVNGHDKWSITDKLFVDEGICLGYSDLNAGYVDTTFFNFPFKALEQKTPVYSASLGMTYLPSEKYKIAANLSSAYRIPNIDDAAKVFESAPGLIIVPNPDLKPESVIGLDLGFTRYKAKKFRWENVLYANLLHNAISLGNATYNGADTIEYQGVISQVMANKNQDRAYVLGFSSIFQAEFGTNYSLFASFNYTYGRIITDTTDYPLDRIQPVFGKLSLEYHKNKVNSMVYVNFNAWKRLSDYNLFGEDNVQYATEKGTPAWITLNYSLSYEIDRFLSIQAGVENIFDTMYRTFSSGINAPGRNIFFTLRGRF